MDSQKSEDMHPHFHSACVLFLLLKRCRFRKFLMWRGHHFIEVSELRKCLNHRTKFSHFCKNTFPNKALL